MYLNSNTASALKSHIYFLHCQLGLGPQELLSNNAMTASAAGCVLTWIQIHSFGVSESDRSAAGNSRAPFYSISAYIFVRGKVIRQVPFNLKTAWKTEDFRGHKTESTSLEITKWQVNWTNINSKNRKGNQECSMVKCSFLKQKKFI